MEGLKRFINELKTDKEIEQTMTLLNKRQCQISLNKKEMKKEEVLKTVTMPNSWREDAIHYINTSDCTAEELGSEHVINTRPSNYKPLMIFSIKEPQIHCNERNCWYDNNHDRHGEHVCNVYHALVSDYMKCDICYENRNSSDDEELIEAEEIYFTNKLY